MSTVPTLADSTSCFTNFSRLTALQTGTKSDTLGRTFPVGPAFDPATSRATTAGVPDPTTRLLASTSRCVRDPFYAGTLGNQTNFTIATQRVLLNQLPSGCLNASAISLLNLLPTPNGSGFTNNYASFPTVTDNSDGVDLRLDQHFND